MKRLSGLRICIVTILAFLAASCSRSGTVSSQRPSEPGSFEFSKKPARPITFLSTQMSPVEEAGKMRNVILKDFPGQVYFRPNDSSYIFSQIGSQLKANPSESILVGASHGDLVTLFNKGSLRNLDFILADLGGRDFPESLLSLARLDGKSVYYIPWMQASFVMLANKKALRYLPSGSSLDTLTYDQFYLWAAAIYEKTGMRSVGFPAGRSGLMHRFLQGCLYPSFTASTLIKFRSAEAREMWAYLKRLWDYVSPGSLVYSNMSEPLLAGDVWIAWDHTARLLKVLEEKPEDFIAFPSPIGPKGRGHMTVVLGLAIPTGVADPSDPSALIDYLTQPVIQGRTLRESGFFPVTESVSDDGTPEHLKELRLVVAAQAQAPLGIKTLPPIGLGERGNDYNDLFLYTFSEIVLESKEIRGTLNRSAEELQRILDEQHAKSWLPDVSEERPGRIE